MHCSRRDREFLHFLLFSAGPADARQAIESQFILDFLHLLHFLLPSPAGLRLAGSFDVVGSGARPAPGRERFSMGQINDA